MVSAAWVRAQGLVVGLGLACGAAVPLVAHADAAALAGACAACHGEGGRSTSASTPKLAGQQPSYVAKQLDEALSGRRKSEQMQACLANIQPSDFKTLGVYFSAQEPAPKAGEAADATLAETGRQLFEGGLSARGISACISCHEAGAMGSDKHPRLARQHGEYILKQIRAFKAGVRNNDKGRQMRNVAEKLTDEDMAAAAAYLSGL